MGRKAIKKEERIKIWNKYNKRCAYCGIKLEYKNMQVDHLVAVEGARLKTYDIHSFNNLMPSCRSCNYYKRNSSLDGFRRNVFHIFRSFTDTHPARFTINLAIRYGIIKLTPWDGLFYFEKIKFMRSQELND